MGFAGLFVIRKASKCISISDPFADAAKGDEESVQDGLVHIRIQQRNGRKTLTTIQGLSAEYDLKKIVRACKKVSEFIQIMKWRTVIFRIGCVKVL